MNPVSRLPFGSKPCTWQHWDEKQKLECISELFRSTWRLSVVAFCWFGTIMLYLVYRLHFCGASQKGTELYLLAARKHVRAPIKYSTNSGVGVPSWQAGCCYWFGCPAASCSSLWLRWVTRRRKLEPYGIGCMRWNLKRMSVPLETRCLWIRGTCWGQLGWGATNFCSRTVGLGNSWRCMELTAVTTMMTMTTLMMMMILSRRKRKKRRKMMRTVFTIKEESKRVSRCRHTAVFQFQFRERGGCRKQCWKATNPDGESLVNLEDSYLLERLEAWFLYRCG